MKPTREKVEHDLLLAKLNRAIFDPDRFKLLSIGLMIASGLFATFFITWVVLRKIHILTEPWITVFTSSPRN